MDAFVIKPNAQTRLAKLINRRRGLMGDKPLGLASPPAPLGVVSTSSVGVRTSFGNLRFLFLIPWLIGISLALFWILEDIYAGWQDRQSLYAEYIVATKMEHGEDYFQKTNDEVARGIYLIMLNESVLPFKNFLRARYLDEGQLNSSFVTDMSFVGAAIAIIVTLIVSILSFHRKAPLYFDRERKIVYTWRSGRAWAQYYDELWYYNNNVAMTFILYRFDKKGRFKMKRFVVTPSGNPFLNGEALYRPVLAFIIQFMEKGRDAVWASDWEGRRGWYLFEDRRPEDLNAQIDKVLAYIDEADVNSKVDQQAAEWSRAKRG